MPPIPLENTHELKPHFIFLLRSLMHSLLSSEIPAFDSYEPSKHSTSSSRIPPYMTFHSCIFLIIQAFSNSFVPKRPWEMT
uniref:Uncharacterized protein n=1 Tax=Arundo donax TaxID=35708 RepID=A0A0A9FRS5_ARUDO